MYYNDNDNNERNKQFESTIANIERAQTHNGVGYNRALAQHNTSIKDNK